MNILNLIGRDTELFEKDIDINAKKLASLVEKSSFLVIGGAGSIGQAVTKEIFTRRPKTLHVVDLSENNLVELVRDIRSSHGYIDGDFRTFALDCGSLEFEVFFKNEGPYDYILNLSALKHVRSEKDPYTLMRMVDVNILNTIKTINLAIDSKTKKYFCVSTDKAANPVNLMGASKRIMEMFLLEKGQSIDISTARFANVAFSEGSLLHGFNQRILKKQAIAAPNDIKRYFITPKEAGELCLISTLLGENGDIFFPKFSKDLNLMTFSSIAEKYLQSIGYELYECENEEEARGKINELISQRKWPCFFSSSDTTGEKDFEEFFTENETINLERFQSLGIVKNSNYLENEKLIHFLNEIKVLKSEMRWTKEHIVKLFKDLIPNFEHKETGKYLDAKM